MGNPSVQHRLRLIAGAAVWILIVAMGMKSILDYETRAGIPAQAPSVWPASSPIPRETGRATLLLFAHPRCPCTRATLGELERSMTRLRGKLDVYVVFARPPGADPSWVRSDRWHEAAAIPGVRLFVDSSGSEARRFGTTTSGQALFYDLSGRLRFAGGITPGRGHAGDNAGADAVIALARSDTAAWSSTPVYGCELCSPAAASKGTTLRCPR